MYLILDSTFVIDHLRGVPAALAARWRRMFEEDDQPVVTEIVVSEVRTGLRLGQTRPTIDRAAAFRPSIVHAGPRDGRAGRRVARRAVSAGARSDTGPDALIAAAAFDLEAVVVTRNVRDFALTPVRVVTY